MLQQKYQQLSNYSTFNTQQENMNFIFNNVPTKLLLSFNQQQKQKNKNKFS